MHVCYSMYVITCISTCMLHSLCAYHMLFLYVFLFLKEILKEMLEYISLYLTTFSIVSLFVKFPI